MQRDLRAAGLANRVVFVEATVDPGRDTVARLAAYQKEFGADWDLWTGTPADIAAFWKPFGVEYQIVPEEQPPKDDWWTGQPLTYDVDHTDGYILIDPAGPRTLRRRDRAEHEGAARPEADRRCSTTAACTTCSNPEAPDWTTADALASISWLLGTNVPASGS